MRRLPCLVMFCAIVCLWNHLLAAGTTEQILRQTDEARGNLEGVIWEVVLESIEQTRPFLSRIVITDELVGSDTTALLFRHPRLQPLPQYIFDLNLLLK